MVPSRRWTTPVGASAAPPRSPRSRAWVQSIARGPDLDASSPRRVGSGMALLGDAVLAIWNDIAPGGDAEFDHWQISEHFPERSPCPGFLRGRRYDRRSWAAPTYFTLYETESVDVLQSAGLPRPPQRADSVDDEVHPALPQQSPHRLPDHAVPRVGRGRSARDPGAGSRSPTGRAAPRLADRHRTPRRREPTRHPGCASLRGRRRDDGGADGGEEAAREAGYARPLGGDGGGTLDAEIVDGACRTPARRRAPGPRHGAAPDRSLAVYRLVYSLAR